MTTKNRLTKLEKTKGVRSDTETLVYKFKQVVREGKSKKFFVDGVQVMDATYAEKLVEYKRLNKHSKIQNELIVFSDLPEGVKPTGSITIFESERLKEN